MPAPFDLPPSGTRQTAAGQTISVRQLQHKIPKGVDRAFQHALKLSRAGKHVSAADDLETVVQREPEFSRAVNQLGIEYAFLGRWEDAEAAFRRVLALEPSSWNAHYNLALILFGRGDLDGAEKSTRRALLFSVRGGEKRSHFRRSWAEPEGQLGFGRSGRQRRP